MVITDYVYGIIHSINPGKSSYFTNLNSSAIWGLFPYPKKMDSRVRENRVRENREICGETVVE
jgi:hypothetical protein